MNLAIACMSGSFKGAFVHGVLYSLEQQDIRGEAYAAASSSTLPAAYAAVRNLRSLDMSIWTDSEAELSAPNGSMSTVVLSAIEKFSPYLRETLFGPAAPRFLIAASLVITEHGAVATQGAGARRLGRKLLIDAARGDSTWRDQNLAARLFDTRSPDPDLELNGENFNEVAYASTRMLHAWPIPASVNGKPYVDASYTCLCPALELAELGYCNVIAIATEPSPVRKDMFLRGDIPAQWKASRIHVIEPDFDLREVGVDFTSATAEGLKIAFEHGVEKGRVFGFSRTGNSGDEPSRPV
jgi:hypothetical protein